MERYEKYKDSGIEWIGEIPEHWESIRLKYIGYLYGGLSGKLSKDFNQDINPDNKPFIPFTNIANNKVIDPSQLQYVVIKEGEKQNKIENGDLFFMMSSENYDDVGKSTILLNDLGETYLNSFCKGFRFTDENYFSPFINYLLLSKPYRSLVQVEANGFTRINLKIDKINDIPLKFPSLEVQITIANYLDRKTAEIKQLIAQKERMIELYEEEKTAIINQSVTKGIIPDVKLKDSGIDWLGEIPEHWEVQRVATLGAFSKGKGIPRSELKESGCPTILYGDIYTKYNIKTDLIFNHISEETTKSSVEIKSGDILFSGSGETKEDIGKCITYVGDETVYVGGDVIILKQEKCNSLFLSYSLNSNACIFQKAGMAKGQIIVHIYASNLREIILPLPSIEEQTQIVQYIETETARIDVKAENTQKLIELLKEYKTALISEVVTGKVRVIN